MPSISARIPNEDAAMLEELAERFDEDKSTVIRKALREGLSELRIRRAIGQYQSGEVSTNQAARMAGVSVAEWLEIAREQNLTSQLSPDNLADDAEAARNL